MPEELNDDWAISIFVPEGEFVVEPDDPSIERHKLGDYLPSFSRVVKVGADEVQEQWKNTVGTLMRLSSTVAAHSQDWTIDEIEVGLTLSAKGELLFIAEAGAEASIKFVLKKRPVTAATTPVASA
jgi:hypothetical protein